MEESDEINVLNEEAKEKFCVDVSVIKSVHKDQQASELQSLDLEVYDVKTFEDGVIAQVEEAIQKRTVEDGELSENSPPSKLQKTDNTDGLGSIEKYLRDQANLQKTKIKGPLEKQLKPKVHKKPQEFFPDKEVKEKKKGKFLGVKKRKKKEKLGTKYGESNSKCNIQPGEANYMYVNSSGSEYVPSSDDSEEERIVKKKKIKKTVSHILNSDVDTNDSNWSSDDEYSKKRKKGFELDDGNLDLFVKRTSCLEKELFKKFHRIDDEYKCPSTVWDQLYKYQKDAVKWFWGLNQERCGGILGDEMGLGKTIQLIAFLSGLYISNITDFDTNYTGLGPTLIVCPTTVMHQWVREFHKWLPPVRVAILHESGTFSGKDRSKLIDSIHNYGPGILITSYNGLVQYKDKMLKKNWHYVVLDEGHKIRNHSAQVTLVAKELYTPHRIILSGSPLQNNLRELWSLFDFIYPGKLGTLNVFIASFQVPIVQGGYTNASTFQVKTAFRCATILKDTITPYLLRRMKSEVEHHIHLPSKTEQVLFCKLTDIQRDFYKHFIESLDLEGIARGRVKIFVGLINLRKICNHPDLYSGGPYNDFKLVDNEDREKQFGYYDRAGKMIVIHKLLKIWFQQNHRVLIFTQSRKMLLIMENYIKNQEYKYLKLDGSTSISARQPMIDLFNREKSYFVMLLTTKVGGLGINLTGANRVIIYDPDWNPATDAQARERAWRIGQEKDVTIYRLITAGTIEEKMYHRQIFKQFLSNKVLKDPKQRRFFKSNDLFELFSLSETVKGGTNETAAIFAGTGSEVELKKPEGKLRDAIVLPQMTFSPSKIEEMKKFAQELSKKIGSKKEDVPSTSKQEVFYGPDGNLTVQNVPQKSIKKEKKGKNTFEGHVVPHLVKCKSVKKKEKPKTITQDEYVLHKLFSKSDIETALKHDTIMEGGPADYAIVEAEADKIAQDALKKLKESSVNIPQPRRINFITPLRNKSNFKEQLFQAINKRKLESNVSSPEMDLVKQIISWICSQGGTASTDSIVEEFAPKLGYEKNAIFKSILSQIAKFYRAPDKKGYWTIKDEFK